MAEPEENVVSLCDESDAHGRHIRTCGPNPHVMAHAKNLGIIIGIIVLAMAFVLALYPTFGGQDPELLWRITSERFYGWFIAVIQITTPVLVYEVITSGNAFGKILQSPMASAVFYGAVVLAVAVLCSFHS